MFALRKRRFDIPALMRLTSWGAAAALALTLAVVSSLSATGSRRATVAVAALTGQEEPPRQVAATQLVPRASDLEGETRRLNEAIRLLAADRDRLLTRVGSLERNLDDMTGSVTRTAAAPKTTPADPEPAAAPISRQEPTPPKTSAVASEPGAAPQAAVPESFLTTMPASLPARVRGWPPASHAAAPGPSVVAPTAAPAASRAATPAPVADPTRTGSIGTKTEFGVDIGSAGDLETLQAIWTETKARHGALVNGLRPVVVMREAKAGGTELRLVIGPFSNASAAAKLCATLGAADILCSAGKFEGQRLALH
jgi:mRNA-degrading endonuclease toxin of MazEF toxin-antitoxin module